jgi:hypothetical protein
MRANRECAAPGRIITRMNGTTSNPNKDATTQARYQQLKAELDSVQRSLLA